MPDTNGFDINGKIAMKLCIAYKKNRHYYCTGLRLTETELQQLHEPLVKGRVRNIRNSLAKLELEAKEAADTINPFSFDSFNDKLFKPTSRNHPISNLFDKKIIALRKNDQVGTASSYQVAMSSLLKFRNEISLQDITIDFLQNYEKWMLSKNKSKTTVGIYLRCLRAILNTAIEDKLISKDEYPFGKRKYKIPTGANTKKALDLASIKKIFEFVPLEGTNMPMAKDFWIFSYLCNGINMKDIAFLKWKNLTKDAIRFERQKTKNTTSGPNPIIEASRNEEIDRIINKWSNKKVHPDNYLFDILNKRDNPEVIQKKVQQFIKTVNKWMKRIGKELDLELTLTTYVARHSFATIIVRNGVSIEFVSQSLGHSSIVTTQKYFAGFDLNAHKENTKALMDF